MGEHAEALMMRSASRKLRKRLATRRSCNASGPQSTPIIKNQHYVISMAKAATPVSTDIRGTGQPEARQVVRRSFNLCKTLSSMVLSTLTL